MGLFLPRNQPRLSFSLEHMLKSGGNGDFVLLCLISVTYVPHCGWHFPPSFPFASPVQKKVIYEADKGEHIL